MINISINNMLINNMLTINCSTIKYPKNVEDLEKQLNFPNNPGSSLGEADKNTLIDFLRNDVLYKLETFNKYLMNICQKILSCNILQECFKEILEQLVDNNYDKHRYVNPHISDIIHDKKPESINQLKEYKEKSIAEYKNQGGTGDLTNILAYLFDENGYILGCKDYFLQKSKRLHYFLNKEEKNISWATEIKDCILRAYKQDTINENDALSQEDLDMLKEINTYLSTNGKKEIDLVEKDFCQSADIPSIFKKQLSSIITMKKILTLLKQVEEKPKNQPKDKPEDKQQNDQPKNQTIDKPGFMEKYWQKIAGGCVVATIIGFGVWGIWRLKRK